MLWPVMGGDAHRTAALYGSSGFDRLLAPEDCRDRVERVGVGGSCGNGRFGGGCWGSSWGGIGNAEKRGLPKELLLPL